MFLGFVDDCGFYFLLALLNSLFVFMFAFFCVPVSDCLPVFQSVCFFVLGLSFILFGLSSQYFCRFDQMDGVMLFCLIV